MGLRFLGIGLVAHFNAIPDAWGLAVELADRGAHVAFTLFAANMMVVVLRALSHRAVASHFAVTVRRAFMTLVAFHLMPRHALAMVFMLIRTVFMLAHLEDPFSLALAFASMRFSVDLEILPAFSI